MVLEIHVVTWHNQPVIQLESLAKKYEEKYKKSGNVGSKLTIEEATFRDIQVV